MVLADDNESPVSSSGQGTLTRATRTGIAGRVLMPSGQPVADASVLVRSLDRPAPIVPDMAVMTGPDGRFVWNVPAGNWEVSVFTLGGNQATKTITVGLSGQAVLNFIIEP
jgi:hypothetical protein